MMTIFNKLTAEYNELHAAIEPFRKGARAPREIVEKRVEALGSTLVNHSERFVTDLSDHSRLYQSIIQDLAVVDSPHAVRVAKEVEKIQYRSSLRKMTLQPKLLAEWLGIHESDFQSNPEKVLRAFEARKKPFKNFEKVFDAELSKMIVSSLGLYDKTVPEVRSLFTDPGLRAMALGAYINEKWLHLSQLNLSFQELKQIAPYLMHVDCRGIPFKDDAEAQEFVQSCSNAYDLIIESDKITELNPFSAKLEYLFCSECSSLRKLSLSNLLSLEYIGSNSCLALNEVTLSNLPSLKEVHLFNSASLEMLVLSDLPSLFKVDCGHCKALKKGSFFNLPSLQKLHCSMCPVLNHLVLNNLPSLQEFYCRQCTALEEIESDGLPNCMHVDGRDCPKLTKLPRFPSRATILTLRHHL